MTRHIYAVTSGDYSDYRVHALFEREEDAKAHAAVFKQASASEFSLYRDEAEVEDFPYYSADAGAPVRMSILKAITIVNPLTGDASETDREVEETWSYAAPSRPQTSVSADRYGRGPKITVITHGPVDLAVQAHADAVAQVRYEVVNDLRDKDGNALEPQRSGL